jgi:ABC-type oligopeptide transport system substrate-binding subunit
MKKILLFLCLLLLATSCASSTVGSKQSQSAVKPTVYYTGNDEPAPVGVFRYAEQEAP